jgi:CheY-like chemotaxis protein
MGSGFLSPREPARPSDPSSTRTGDGGGEPGSMKLGWLDAHALDPQRILLAEDDLEMRRLLSSALRKDGYEVIEAKSGAELLTTLAEFLRHPTTRPYDLIISDQRMPGLTGLEVLEGLEDEDWLPPFILITAFGSREFETDALCAGAARVLDKPFDVDDLRKAVAGLIGPPVP